jgi:hypothetical protein
MKALRIAVAAIALAAVSGMANDARADWVVRVELENQFTGQYTYPTLYSSSDYDNARDAFDWYEMLMKAYPSKFRSDVLDPLGIPWYRKPNTQRMYLIYLPPLNPTGRQINPYPYHAISGI